MKKVWKGVAAAISAAAIAAAGFIGASSAMAAPTTDNQITAPNDGHTYEAYQILTGDVTSEDVFSNAVAGSNFNTDFSKVEGFGSSQFTGVADAKGLAAYLDGKTGTTALANDIYKYFVTGNGTEVPASNLTSGYYLIEDTTETLPATTEDNPLTQDTRNRFVLVLLGGSNKTFEVKKKHDTVTSVKKVKENNTTTLHPITGTEDSRIPGFNVGEGFNDVADYSIGDEIEFKLIGTLPNDYAEYTTFSYQFNDTLSKGLDYVANSVAVKDENGTDLTSHFDITANGQSLTIAAKMGDTDNPLKGLKEINGLTKDSKIIVTYKAKLNSSAVIGLGGNENKMTLTFSNNPNQGGEGDTGTTPEDKVVVFTYELDVDKYDAKDPTNKLDGAKFKLWKDANKTEGAVVANGKFTGWTTTAANVTELTTGDNGDIQIAGLDSGTYYLEETVAPEGYNKLEDLITITLTATTVNNQAWSGTASEALTALKISVDGTEKDGNTSTGVVVAGVGNNKGSSLPSTGGMGTTILYTVGAIIVLAAAAGLTIALRRRNA